MADLESWSCRGEKLIPQCTLCIFMSAEWAKSKVKIINERVKCLLKRVTENSSAQFLQVKLWQKGMKRKEKTKCVQVYHSKTGCSYCIFTQMKDNTANILSKQYKIKTLIGVKVISNHCKTKITKKN